MNSNDFVRIPEKHKRPGVFYAVTLDGIEVPVIDVSSPDFVCAASRDELDRIAAETMRGWNRSRYFPRFVGRLMARRSLLMRGTLEATGGFLSGMASYFQKLKPEFLGSGYASSLDRRLAVSLGPMCMRLRIQTMAAYLAEAIWSIESSRPGRTVRLINIGGGPSADSLNALILLRRDHPDLLKGRTVSIDLFDPDLESTLFGKRCLAALTAPDAPLHEVQVEFNHCPLSWSDRSGLQSRLGQWRLKDENVTVSSEGGLFEYGSDDDIKAVLELLAARTADDCTVVGSFFRNHEVNRTIKELGRLTIQPRGLAAFSALVHESGWTLDQVEADNPMSCVVTMRKN